MKKHFLFTLLPSLVAILFFSSCMKDLKDLENIDGVEVNPHLSVPLVNAHMGMKDLYNSYSEKATILEGPDKFLTFIYESRDSLSSRQFITFPAIDLNYDFKMDQGAIAVFNTTGGYTNSFSNYAVIKTSNKEQLKLVKIRNGNFVINVTSKFKHNSTFIYTYPSITKNGRPLTDTIHLNYTGSPNPIVINKIISLDDYDLDLSDRGISYNVIPYMITMDITRNPSSSTGINDNIAISQQLNIAAYRYVEGYLGKFTLFTQSADDKLDIFNGGAKGSILLNDPKIRIRIENGIGLPVTARITNIRILTSKNDTFPIRIDQFKDTFTFNYPAIVQKGQIIEGNYVIDKTNSNIDSVINLSPQHVYYDIEFIANTNENTNETNFLYDDNFFKTSATFEIPLDVKVINYTVQSHDTVGWGEEPKDYQVDWIKFTSYVRNTFPISNKIQFYFTIDSLINNVDSFVVVDSLYDTGSIEVPGAVVDNNGKVISPSERVLETPMKWEKYLRLRKKSNGSFVVTEINTSSAAGGSGPFVKIYSDQGMDFKVGVEAKGKYIKKF